MSRTFPVRHSSLSRSRRRSVLCALIAAVAGALALGTAAATGARVKQFRVVQVAAVVNDPYFVSMRCGGAAEAKKLGVSYSFVGPAAPDVGAELSAFNNAAVTNPDGMIVSPFSPTAFLSSIGSLMSRGVPVTLVDGNSAKNDHYRWYHTNLAQAAKSIAGPIAQATGGEGTLAIIASAAGDPDDTQRFSELVPALTKLAPNLKILSPEYVNTNSAKAASVTSSLLLAHPDLKAIWATNGAEAQGVVSALKTANKLGQVKVFAFDATPSEVASLKAGEIEAVVAQAPYLAGALGVKATVAYLRAHRGRHVVQPGPPTKQPVPFKILTKANVGAPSSEPFLYRPTC